ncbi:hypothetical protein RJ641_009031 [Dillenia turbinata]|uniref:DUF7950 domain-containing protein n=1 Tax=Dillenia turbinata TaxID=194707 RepID=A0AAN8Z6X8_9MAGN
MDGRGGCCIARYGGGGGGGAYDMSKIDRIMLRFRPIAPKPTMTSSTTGSSVSEKSNTGRPVGRKRRNNVSQSSNSKKRRRRVKDSYTPSSSSSPEEEKVSLPTMVPVTLSLMPETSEKKLESQAERKMKQERVRSSPIWLCFGGNDDQADRAAMMMPQPMRLVGSYVTVECVTDSWLEEDGLGSTDEEKMKGLEEDTCPGFASDGLYRVWWTNGAYKEMMGVESMGEMVVWLVLKGSLPPVTVRGFTCSVRLQYTSARSSSHSLTVPCDVWRLDAGGFAWRLDVKAALSLGR